MNGRPAMPANARIHWNAVPEHAAAALDRLYAHPFATLAYQRIIGGDPALHTYVEADGERIETVLLFRLEGRRARVVNEFARLDEARLRRFAATLFAEIPQLHVISLCALHADTRLDGIAHQRHLDRADIVAELPASPDAYLAALHRNTRATIRARLNKLRRDHPDFEYVLLRGAEIDGDTIRTLIDFNRARMRAVGKHSYNDAGMEQVYLRLCRECDATLLRVTIGGQVRAGSFNLMAGSGCFGMLNAFDAAWAKYSLGTVAAYLNVCAAIEIGARRFHFGWEPYEYKTHLLGVPQPSWRYELYRSRLHMARMAPHALRAALYDRVRGVKRWMQAPQRRDSRATRLALASVHRARDLHARLRGG